MSTTEVTSAHAAVPVVLRLIRGERDDRLTGLTASDRQLLAASAAIEADGIAQDNAGSHDPQSFGWVEDLNAMVTLIDDLLDDRPLRSDAGTRDALQRILYTETETAAQYVNERVAFEDMAAQRSCVDVVRRALELVRVGAA